MFITFEGGDGAGKTTQIQMLAQSLQKAGYDVHTTREPGGTQGGEIARDFLLGGFGQCYGPATEAILFSAARADHMDMVIKPALLAGKIVLCDRFIDSTRVYQSSGTSPNFLKVLERCATLDVFPDLTFILDIPAIQGLKRASRRRATDSCADRFEKETIDVHEERRKAFLSIAAEEPKRCRVINALLQPQVIAQKIYAEVTQLLNKT